MEAQASLMELLEGLRDPRRVQGKRHPPPALLGLAVVAMLAGMSGYEAIVEYGKERGWGSLPLLGFTTRWVQLQAGRPRRLIQRPGKVEPERAEQPS